MLAAGEADCGDCIWDPFFIRGEPAMDSLVWRLVLVFHLVLVGGWVGGWVSGAKEEQDGRDGRIVILTLP